MMQGMPNEPKPHTVRHVNRIDVVTVASTSPVVSHSSPSGIASSSPNLTIAQFDALPPFGAKLNREPEVLFAIEYVVRRPGMAPLNSHIILPSGSTVTDAYRHIDHLIYKTSLPDKTDYSWSDFTVLQTTVHWSPLE